MSCVHPAPTARRETLTISPTNRLAVTFIELLIVIIILGFLAGLAAPNFKKTFDNLELENFVRDIYYLCQYLQASSVSSANLYRLDIDLEKGELSAASREGNDFQPLSGRLGKIYRAPAQTLITLYPPDKTSVYFYPDARIDNIKISLENKHKKLISLNIQGASSAIQIQ